MAKIDWRGYDDGTPDAMPASPDNENNDPIDNDDGDWHGMDDGTPSAMPMSPDREPVK